VVIRINWEREGMARPLSLSRVDTFSECVRELVMEGQHGYCAAQGCTNPIQDFHHRLANTKTNRKLFPLFLQSVFNCCGLCHLHHHDKSLAQFKISYDMARAYEQYLRESK